MLQIIWLSTRKYAGSWRNFDSPLHLDQAVVEAGPFAQIGEVLVGELVHIGPARPSLRHHTPRPLTTPLRARGGNDRLCSGSCRGQVENTHHVAAADAAVVIVSVRFRRISSRSRGLQAGHVPETGVRKLRAGGEIMASGQRSDDSHHLVIGYMVWHRVQAARAARRSLWL